MSTLHSGLILLLILRGLPLCRGRPHVYSQQTLSSDCPSHSPPCGGHINIVCCSFLGHTHVTHRNKDLMYSTDLECARGCENRKNDVIRRRMPIQNVKRSGIVCCYARHSYSVLNQLPTRPHGKVLIPRERATSQTNPVPVPIGFRDLLRKRFSCVSVFTFNHNRE